MRGSGISLTVAALLLLAGGCGSSASVAGRSQPQRPPSTPTLAVHGPDQLEAAMPSAGDLPGGYEILVDCQAPEDPGCEMGAAPGVYNVLTASGRPGTDNWGLADSIYVVAVSFTASEAATDFVADFRQSTERDFTGTIAVKARTDGETGIVPGERGTGSLNSFSAGDWHGNLATKTSRLTDATGKTSPLGVYATITASSGRAMLTISTVHWTGERDVATAAEEVRALFGDYLARLAS